MNKFTFDENAISDLHKDAYGFRPGQYFWADWAEASDHGKQEIWDELIVVLHRAVAEEEERERVAISDFERDISHNMAHGAKDRATAIFWMLDSTLEDWTLSYGGEHACFTFGLPFSMQTELNPIIDQLRIQRCV
jgi:hypothetical protein